MTNPWKYPKNGELPEPDTYVLAQVERVVGPVGAGKRVYRVMWYRPSRHSPGVVYPAMWFTGEMGYMEECRRIAPVKWMEIPD